MNLYLASSFSPSLVLFRRNFIEKLVSNGCSVKVVAPDFPGNVHQELDLMNVKCKKVHLSRTGINPIADLLYTIRLALILLNEKPNYFFAYTIKPVIYGSIAAWISGVPKKFVMITGAGFAFGSASLKQRIVSRIVKFLYRFALKRVNRVIFQNNDDRNLFLSNRLVVKEQIALVNGSGVDLGKYKYSSLNLKKPISFLMVARLLKAKGVLEYLNSARIASRELPNSQWILVGPYDDGNPDGISKAAMLEYLKSTPVQYIGSTDDVISYLKECSVFVLPSYREGLPRSVLEAMAIGRPIITTNVPGCRETVKHGFNGMLVKAKDSEALANAMIEISNYSYKLKNMGENSRHIAEAKFDADKIATEMTDIMGIK